MQSSLEIFKSNYSSDAPLESIIYSENLSYYQGFGLSPNVKLFVFKHQPGAFSINLITQKLKYRSIAIVPPGQLHFLSPVECTDFICIEVPPNVLIDEDFGFMTRLLYSTQKHLHLGKMEGFDYDQIKIILSSENNHQLSLQLLKSKIEKAYPNQFGEFERGDENFVELARQFEALLRGIEHFTVDHTIINPYTEALYCSEKALYRACKSVFNVSPQNLLKYQLLMRSIPLLFNKKYTPELIACKVGYSSVSAFTRFIKLQTNSTPGKIRKQLVSNVKFRCV
ncbi:MAG: helix-turn-helix domain-containing protein [Bacteroidota bacterium]